jgi:hypothetical protein
MIEFCEELVELGGETVEFGEKIKDFVTQLLDVDFVFPANFLFT